MAQESIAEEGDRYCLPFLSFTPLSLCGSVLHSLHLGEVPLSHKCLWVINNSHWASLSSAKVRRLQGITSQGPPKANRFYRLSFSDTDTCLFVHIALLIFELLNVLFIYKLIRNCGPIRHVF